MDWWTNAAGGARMSADPLMQETLIKRSQQKKRTSPLNYKERLFVLTKTRLTYYEGRPEVTFIVSFSNMNAIWWHYTCSVFYNWTAHYIALLIPVLILKYSVFHNHSMISWHLTKLPLLDIKKTDYPVSLGPLFVLFCRNHYCAGYTVLISNTSWSGCTSFFASFFCLLFVLVEKKGTKKLLATFCF